MIPAAAGLILRAAYDVAATVLVIAGVAWACREIGRIRL